jgi:hypothetical protein
MYYKNWGPCLQLLKIVIYEVPTEYGHYADYKLISLFDNVVAYLEGGSERWRLLEDPDHFRHPCNCYRRKYCDAIDHGGFVYAVYGRGYTYCWDAAEDANFFGLFVALHHTLTETLKLFL